ncbi:MAG: ATP-dependent Clp protease ATP-binding subunit, partial [Calditrichaeota bacterium]|nr:ATP-dependent Clp protease ATP-binding subunit [Calditrichota bacterium]
ATKLKDRDIEVELTKGARELLATKGFDPVFGARPLRRTIQKMVEDPIAEEILRGRFGDGSRIRIGHKGGNLTFTEIGRKQVRREGPREEGRTEAVSN